MWIIMTHMDERTAKLIESMKSYLEANPRDAGAWSDLLALCKAGGDAAAWAIERLAGEIAKGGGVVKLFRAYRGFLLADAPKSFDSYMQYLEIDREADERFWLPRRAALLPVVKELQAMADGELDELFLAMPPRCGKTTLMLMYTCWIVGRNSELSNLYCSYSDTITRSFYSGLLEIMTDADTYNYAEIFPATIARTNAADEIIDVKRSKHYPSITCRSLYGTLNGACDANGLIIGDDLVSGIEEVLSPGRMDSVWLKVDNNMLPRAKEKAKLLWIGTRWSINDPQGRRLSMLEAGGKLAKRRYRAITIPALNANDESNFDYEYGVGFSTQYFQERRESFEKNNDTASWSAQYMGLPIEREGTVFQPDGFRYYNGTLPDETPDRVIMVCDPAFGGGDFVSAPVGYLYGDDLYIHDVVFDAGDKRITQPKVAAAAVNNNVSILQFEATKSTKSYANEVGGIIRKRGGHTAVTTKPAPSTMSKQAKIFDKAPEIRERCIFRDVGARSKEYSMFMQNLFSFKLNMNKHAHDDAPDSMAQLVDFVWGVQKTAQVVHRFF